MVKTLAEPNKVRERDVQIYSRRQKTKPKIVIDDTSAAVVADYGRRIVAQPGAVAHVYRRTHYGTIGLLDAGHDHMKLATPRTDNFSHELHD